MWGSGPGSATPSGPPPYAKGTDAWLADFADASFHVCVADKFRAARIPPFKEGTGMVMGDFQLPGNRNGDVGDGGDGG
jgi:hypothetical protein